jgi:hypothetical protein
VLLQALNHSNSHVWHAAAEALWLMDEATMPYILESLIDSDETMRQAALKALLWLSAEFDDEEVADRSDDEWVGMWGWWN